MKYLKNLWNQVYAAKKSQCGATSVNGILVLAVMASVTFIVLANLWPSMQTAYTAISTTSGNVAANTSNTMFGLLLWIIPLGIGLALLIRIFSHKE
jgi:hypothetical protein